MIRDIGYHVINVFKGLFILLEVRPDNSPVIIGGKEIRVQRDRMVELFQGFPGLLSGNVVHTSLITLHGLVVSTRGE